MRIAITGATGWVARSTNAAIAGLVDMGLDLKVENFSSTPEEISLIDGVRYETKSYDELNKSNFDLYVPLGFPTQEKFVSLGEEIYKYDVEYVIQRDRQALKANPAAKVLLISSGVVNGLSEAQAAKSSYRYYANMKIAQEESLRNSVGENNLNVCFLYSCTSVDIREFDSYALSSMVQKAINNEDIYISNALPVIRKYIDLRELFTVMFLEILAGGTFRISSGGPKIEIEELANLIIKKTKSASKSVRAKLSDNSNSDIYFSEDSAFEELFQRHRQKYSDLNTQIENVLIAARNII